MRSTRLGRVKRSGKRAADIKKDRRSPALRVRHVSLVASLIAALHKLVDVKRVQSPCCTCVSGSSLPDYT